MIVYWAVVLGLCIHFHQRGRLFPVLAGVLALVASLGAYPVFWFLSTFVGV